MLSQKFQRIDVANFFVARGRTPWIMLAHEAKDLKKKIRKFLLIDVIHRGGIVIF